MVSFATKSTCIAIVVVLAIAPAAGAEENPQAPSDAAAPPRATPAASSASTAPPDAAPATSSAAEQPKPTREIRMPRLHHAPPAVARPHEPLVVVADIDYADRVRRAVLVYRRETQSEYEQVEFRRGAPGPYAATIPAKAMDWPGVEYAIEMENVDGERQPVFASRAEPHRVEVPEDLMDVRERALNEDVGGRRSVVSAVGEYVDFGESSALVAQPTGAIEERLVDDRYYRIEAAYTYRVLRTVSEFSIRLGLVRGRAPVPGTTDSNDFDVGLNYASPSIRLRLADAWHLDGQFLTSVTEVGFSVGAGAALHIGDVYGTQLVTGFEAIEVFGTRFFSRVDVRATDRLILSPVIEATNMPHADQYGVRLLGEIAYDIGSGLTLGVSGGYQAREATSGGPSVGVKAAWAL